MNAIPTSRGCSGVSGQCPHVIYFAPYGADLDLLGHDTDQNPPLI